MLSRRCFHRIRAGTENARISRLATQTFQRIRESSVPPLMPRHTRGATIVSPVWLSG
jgi:hypothetical protein